MPDSPCDGCGNTLLPRDVFIVGNDRAQYRVIFCDNCSATIRTVMSKKFYEMKAPPTPKAGIPRITTADYLKMIEERQRGDTPG